MSTEAQTQAAEAEAQAVAETQNASEAQTAQADAAAPQAEAENNSSLIIDINSINTESKEEKPEVGVESKEEYKTGDELIDALIEVKKKHNISITKDFLKDYFDDTDFDTASAKGIQQVLTKSLKKQGFTDEEIAVELEDTFPDLYGYDADPDSAEYNRALVRAGIKAKAAAKQLMADREKIFIPDGKGNLRQEILESLSQETEKSLQLRKKQLAYVADAATQNYEKEVFQAGDMKWEFDVSKEMSAKVNKIIRDYDNFHANNIITNDGKYDVAKMRRIALLSIAEADVLKAGLDVQASVAKEEMLKKDFQNVNVKGNRQTERPDDYYDGMAKAIIASKKK